MTGPTISTRARLPVVGVLCVLLAACGSSSSPGSAGPPGPDGGGAPAGGAPPGGLPQGGGGGAGEDRLSVLSLRVAPAGYLGDAAARVPRGYILGLTATALLEDGSSRDVTPNVVWSSADPAKVAVSNASGSYGVVTALAAGAVDVTATDRDTGASGTITVEVTAATLVSILVGSSASFAELPVGIPLRFYAVGFFSDSSALDISGSVQWTSTNPAVANVARGIVTTSAQGGTAIYATDPISGIPSSPHFVVVGPEVLASISIELQSNDLLPEGTRPISAYGNYPDPLFSPLPQFPFFRSYDLGDVLSWSSSDPSVIVVEPAPGGGRQVRAIAPGTATLTAVDPSSGIVGSAAYTVFQPAQLAAFDAASAVVGGNALRADLDMSVPISGADPQRVSIASSDPLAVPAATCHVETGTAKASCELATRGVTAPTTVTLTASYRERQYSAQVTVAPARLRAIVAAPSSVQGGAGATLTVALDGAAGAGLDVALSSSAAAVQVPPVATIAAGTSQVDVAIHTAVVAEDLDVEISASAGGVLVDDELTVLQPPPPGAVVALHVPTAVLPNVFDSISSTVTIVPDPVNDTEVTITSLDPAVLSLPPQGTTTRVVIPATLTTAAFTIQSAAPGASVFATLTASSGGRSESADVLVQWVPTF